MIAVNLDSLEREVERHWYAETERKCAFEQQQKNKMERAAYPQVLFCFIFIFEYLQKFSNWNRERNLQTKSKGFCYGKL